jgi:hypothetical protein
MQLDKRYRRCSCGYTKTEKTMITLKDYWMGRDAKYASSLTPEIEQNAKDLLDKVNMFLDQMGIKSATVTSGWRPPAVNDGTANAATHSNHLIGLAVDIHDADGKLRETVLANLDKAQALGIYFEDMRWTPTWVHMQIRPSGSGHRIYVPSTAAPLNPHAWSGKYDSKFDKA